MHVASFSKVESSMNRNVENVVSWETNFNHYPVTFKEVPDDKQKL